MKDLSFKSLLPILSGIGQKLQIYLTFFLFLLLAGIYGFTIVKISSLSNPVIDDEEVLTKVTASPTAGIDENAAKKLESLKDNSVNVQVLFEEGRKNPFQE